MTQLLTELNKKAAMWAEFMYDGFDRYIEIEGGCFTPFVGTWVDMEITLTNCVGDKHSYRNFFEMTRESIWMYNHLGEKVTMSGTVCLPENKCPI